MKVGDWIAALFAALWAIVAISLATAAAIRARKANRYARRSSEADTRATAATERASQLTRTQAEINVPGWEIVTEGQQGNWFPCNGSTEDAFDVAVTDGDLGMTLIQGDVRMSSTPRAAFC